MQTMTPKFLEVMSPVLFEMEPSIHHRANAYSEITPCE